MSSVESFIDCLNETIPKRELANVAATQLLLTDPWPTKFVGWRNSAYVIDEPGWTCFHSPAIRDGIDSRNVGPQSGWGYGEMRVQVLACLDVTSPTRSTRHHDAYRYQAKNNSRVARANSRVTTASA